MPLIVPVLTAPAAAPAATPVPAAAEATATAPSPGSANGTPRFADALSRAGQTQNAQPTAADTRSAAAQPNASAQPSPPNPASRESGADSAQQPEATAADGAAATALALQASGALEAATPAAPSGKTLPHDRHSADAAAALSPASLGAPSVPVVGALAALVPPPTTPAPTMPSAKTTAEPAVVSLAAQAAAQPHMSALQSPQQPVGGFGASLPAASEHLQGDATASASASVFAALQQTVAKGSDTATAAVTSAPPRGESTSTSTVPLPLAQSIALPLTAPTSQGAAPAVVHPAVGSPDWGQAMNQQVLLAAQGQQQFATLHLNPPQLGPLEVHLQLHEGQIQAQFVSPHAVVRQAVEAALPQLRDLFTGAGLSLMQTSVGSQGGQGAWQQAAPRGSQTASGLQAVDAASDPVGLATTRPQRWQQGLVNTYA